MNPSPLDIKATRNSPAVQFDPAAHAFTVIGNSIPENAGEFYSPVIDWLKAELPGMPNNSSFTFCLPYFNSSSLKAIYMLLMEIKEAMDQGKAFDVVWHVEEDDDFMTDAADTFTEMSGIQFTLKTGLLS